MGEFLGDREFITTALKFHYLTQEQIKECRQVQKSGEERVRLHEIALKNGFISEEISKELRAKSIERPRHIIGGYEIKSIIGEGGLGVVYLAKQLSMKRDVALKVLHPKWVTDEEFRKRFLLEARIVGKLSHTNLIQVFDIGWDKGFYYFSMEYVAGRTVEEIIRKEGPIPIPKALDICIQVLRAIKYIAEYNLIHRDIKPSNIILTPRGVAKLGDFGFVKSKMDKELGSEEFVLGTPDYMSPEQAIGREDINFKSDIYSLGATLYHMVTGTPPYHGTESMVIRQHIKADIPSPKSLNPVLSDDLCLVIEKMMAKDPADRYSDLQDLYQDFELLKIGEHPTAQRLDLNKSTILRSDEMMPPVLRIRFEKERVERLVKEMERRQSQYQLIIALLGVLIVLLILLLIITR